MAAPIDLEGPALAPASGGQPDALVVLLHGIGADGHDLIGLAEQWAPLLPNAAFASPHAPFASDMSPMGFQWFSLQERTAAAILAGIQVAQPILDAYVDRQLAAHGLSDDRLALVGFSQGTMMALYAAPQRPRACAAVVGYSGALFAATELERAPSKPPVLLVHGDADDVVPVQASINAGNVLGQAGFDVRTEVRPGLGHGIDPVGLRLGGEFLARHLG
ncbi:MAG: alpha/beta fold hydrolase [Alphaproteobacteria bacterium]